MILMTQRSGKYFYKTEIQGIFLHQLWAFLALSVRIVYETIYHQVLRDACDKYDYVVAYLVITLRYEFTEVGVLWHMVFEGEIGVRQTKPACLLNAAELSHTGSSPVEASRHWKFI